MLTLNEIQIFMWNSLTINIFHAIIKTFRGEGKRKIPKGSSSWKEDEVRCIWQWSCESMYVICYIRNTFWTKPCRIASNVFTYARRPRVKQAVDGLCADEDKWIHRSPQFPLEIRLILQNGIPMAVNLASPINLMYLSMDWHLQKRNFHKSKATKAIKADFYVGASRRASAHIGEEV